MSPTLRFNEIATRELKAAGVVAQAVKASLAIADAGAAIEELEGDETALVSSLNKVRDDAAKARCFFANGEYPDADIGAAIKRYSTPPKAAGAAAASASSSG
jgi:hypothetical protein